MVEGEFFVPFLPQLFEDLTLGDFEILARVLVN
jgi:hypothetical protein